MGTVLSTLLEVSRYEFPSDGFYDWFCNYISLVSRRNIGGADNTNIEGNNDANTLQLSMTEAEQDDDANGPEGPTVHLHIGNANFGENYGTMNQIYTMVAELPGYLEVDDALPMSQTPPLCPVPSLLAPQALHGHQHNIFVPSKSNAGGSLGALGEEIQSEILEVPIQQDILPPSPPGTSGSPEALTEGRFTSRKETQRNAQRRALLIKSGLDEVRQSDIVIVVMGQTKAGKSTFINSLVDNETKHRKVGHRMVSETSNTSAVVVERAPSQYAALNHLLDNRRIVLVDTPGFDNTAMNHAVVLTSISQWLLASYGEGMCVGGILHLRDITQSGWNGVEQRDFDVFSKICGDDGMRQVSLITTKWGRFGEPGKYGKLVDGISRVEELLNEYWRSAIEKGASVFHLCPPNCFDNNLELAGATDDPWHILQQIITSMDTLGISNRIIYTKGQLANLKHFLSEFNTEKP